MHFLFLLLISVNSWASDKCDSWLISTKAKPGTSSCETICASANIDMGTFSCPSRCESYCRKKLDCTLDSFWHKRLNSNPSPFKPLTGNEKELVINALSKLPKTFRPRSLKAIVKASGSDPLSRSNPASSSDEFIILFPATFSSNIPIDRVLFHEMIHQMSLNEWSKTLSDYKKAVQWADNSPTPRAGEFLDPDGRSSAEEDLANNVESYVFEPEKLKLASIKIHSWIEKNLKSQIKFEKGCNEKNLHKK